MALLKELWSGFLIRARLRRAIREAGKCRAELATAISQRDDAIHKASQITERNEVLQSTVDELMLAHKRRLEQLETEAAYYTVLRKKWNAGEPANVNYPSS